MLSLSGITGESAKIYRDLAPGWYSPGLNVVDRVLGQVRVPEQFHNVLGQEQIALVRRYGEGEGGQGFLVEWRKCH